MDNDMSEKKPFTVQIRYLLLPLLFAILGFVFYLMNYLGTFKPVIISEKNAGPFHLVYKSHVGAYHKIVPLIEEVEKWVKAQGLNCKLSFGEYLDDPRQTEEVRLRSLGGCLMPEPVTALPEGFEQKTLPERKYVVAVFEGSPGIGPLKVYPKVYQYLEDQKLSREDSVLEVYEVHSQEAMTTTYYFPIKTP
jgi:AraC family transcriptional regulator